MTPSTAYIAKSTVEVDGDFLVLNDKKIQTSRCRNPNEVGWGALGANYVLLVLQNPPH